MALMAATAEEPFSACICRRTYPELRLACWEPSLSILGKMRVKQRVLIRKSPALEIVFADEVRIMFRNADDPADIKGAEFDVWVLDEANDISRDFYEETLIRVPRADSARFMPHARHILSWNPVSRGAWVYDEFFAGECPADVQIVHSTYQDNPFVLPEMVKQLETWRETDPRRWEVYGLGEWGSPDELIYPSWEFAPPDAVPVGRKYDAIGIDFGYANPTAVVGLWLDGTDAVIVDEILYASGIPISELCTWAAGQPALFGVPVYCDPSAPGSIADIQRVGIRADDAENDVQQGISFLQGRRIKLTPRSVNLHREIIGYAWQRDVHGRITDKPVKIMDHACDAMRYAAYTLHRHGYDRAEQKLYRGYLPKRHNIRRL